MADVQITEVPVGEEAAEEAVAPPVEPAELEALTPAPKKRGRPVGSKNRAKAAPPDPPPLERSPQPDPAPPKKPRAKPKAKPKRELSNRPRKRQKVWILDVLRKDEK